MKQNASQYMESYFVTKVAIRPLGTQVTLSIRNTVSEYLEFCHRNTHTRQSYKYKYSVHYMYHQWSLYVPPV